MILVSEDGDASSPMAPQALTRDEPVETIGRLQ
jgi:hypothetical protein